MISILASLFIVIFSLPAFASNIDKIKTINIPGEKFTAKVFIDSKDKNINLKIGSKMDYKLLNAIPPDFLDYLYIYNPSNLYEEDRRVVYVISKKQITASEFPLVLKLFAEGEKPSVKRFDIKLSKHIKQSAYSHGGNKNKIELSMSGRYRQIERDINVSGESIKSNTILTIFRFDMGIKDGPGLFFDIGSGILKLEDTIQYNSLPVPLTMKRYDGGRGFAYGGGIRGKVFDRYNIKLDMMANVTKFSNDSAVTTQKLLNTKTEASWMEYKGDVIAAYNKFLFLQPYIGASYSKIEGDFKVTETVGTTINYDTRDFDEKSGFGIIAGMEIIPIKEVKIIGEARLINETGFMISLRWMFKEI